MKVSLIILAGLLSFLPVKVPDTESEQVKNEVLTISPNPANNFLDIKVNPEKLTDPGIKKFTVRIFNLNGSMVFSTTKEIHKFSVFTGGLPEGDYTLTLKADSLQVQKDFRIKH